MGIYLSTDPLSGIMRHTSISGVLVPVRPERWFLLPRKGPRTVPLKFGLIVLNHLQYFHCFVREEPTFPGYLQGQNGFGDCQRLLSPNSRLRLKSQHREGMIGIYILQFFSRRLSAKRYCLRTWACELRSFSSSFSQTNGGTGVGRPFSSNATKVR